MFGFEKPGVTYTRTGNTIFGSDGSSHTITGNTIFNSDGSTIMNYHEFREYIIPFRWLVTYADRKHHI